MAMEQILDFSQELDVALLDQIVSTMYASIGQEQIMAQRVLTQLQEHPDAWQRVDQILQKAKNMPTKYLALQILERTIQTRWKVLPRDQCEGIKNFIVGIIVEVSSDENRFRAEKNYLNKLNLTLVQVLKQEWPKNWPTFLPEIIASSKSNITLCENNMLILRYLSEEIFDFSAESMTQAKIRQLKEQMCKEFSDIFSLCNEVLSSSDKPSLTRATLETLLRFLGWIPLGFIFETDLLENLPNRFLPNRQFSNVALKCLSEIGSLTTPAEYFPRLQKLFHDSMSTLVRLVGQELQMAKAFEDASNSDQEFVQNLANFLTGFLGEHLKLVEAPETDEPLMLAHQYLLQISKIEERELFKVCLEYWTKLVAGLYAEYPSSADAPLTIAPPLQPMRRNRYVQVLHDLRIVMIESMVKPEEVLVVETDEGEVIRERQKESDTIVLYKSMREVLVYLTHLDTDDTEATMSAKLARQADNTEWSWSNLNKLCWAIGSISGAMSETVEKRFLVQIIKDLLGLTEAKRGKDNKAVVASNIMYIVGQYPRFLKAHWKFLKTVLNKLFEFMHESHEGVQDMACDTFIKIANKCRRHFTVHQSGEDRPFVEEILLNMPNIIDMLSPGQIQVFYEAMGHMIAAENREQQQANLLKKLFEEPNAIWDRVISMAGNSLDVLHDQENTRALAQCLKVNNAACTSVGHPFITQFARIYMDMLGLYKAVSEIISAAVANEGVLGTKTPRVRNLRILKKEVLKLVESYISKSEDKYVVMTDCIPALLEAVLLDYQSNHEQARDSEVLNMMASIVNKMGEAMNDYIPGILDAVLDCTLQMISKDFQEYPEHRAGFYGFIHAVVANCFTALLGLPADKFKLVMDSIIWGIKHTMRDIADVSLQTILALLQSVQKLDPAVSSGFYQNYLMMMMQDTFFVLTDTAHKSGFKLQCMILAEIYRLVESNAIQGPLSPQMASGESNSDYMRNHTMQLLQGAFPHLQPIQIQSFVVQLFNINQDIERFKSLLKDFLVQLKEFAGEDNAELYIEERELEAANRQKTEFEEALKVPGLVNPHARPEGMED